jgi:alpha-glucosidase (family GH31 glycosyl hydrolase)
MIGGGSWAVKVDPNFRCDEELFVRMAQCSALFPMMQFSWAPWRALGEESQRHCLEAARLHGAFADTIVSLVKNAMETGEPVIRMLEYNYPHKGYGRVLDQFMLGEDVLVCPVIQKGKCTRKVILPPGKWEYCDGKLYEGDTEVEVPAPIDVLPYFRKVGHLQ